MIKDLQQHIISEFGSDVTREAYRRNAEKGLWVGEKVLIEKYFQLGSSILDIGCGTGRTTIPLFEMGYKITGIDITPEMIEDAKAIAKKKNLGIEYKVGDASKFDYAKNFFDNAIFSNNGWSQIPGREKRQEALSEIFRVLKSGGYLIFTTHARTWKGYEFLWIKQWIKMFLLKPLRFRFDEIDFGDIFFQRETSGGKFKQKQFIHIPNVDKIKNQIKQAGFKLVLAKRENEIVDYNLHDKDNVFNRAPIFYVCKKP
jgi:ubiquinone/menaquinone biosynthesis C-methylase UbiE